MACRLFCQTGRWLHDDPLCLMAFAARIVICYGIPHRCKAVQLPIIGFPFVLAASANTGAPTIGADRGLLAKKIFVNARGAAVWLRHCFKLGELNLVNQGDEFLINGVGRGRISEAAECDNGGKGE